MPLDPLQKTAADILAVRILLGQLIVRIAAGSQDPTAVLKIMSDSATQTAERAKLRDLPEPQQEELRQHLKGSIERFFAAMRIEPKKEGAPGGNGTATPAGKGKPGGEAAKAKEAKKT